VVRFALAFGATAVSRIDIASLLKWVVPVLWELERVQLGEKGKEAKAAYEEAVRIVESNGRYVGKTGLFTAGPDLGLHLAFLDFDELPLLQEILRFLVKRNKTREDMQKLLELLEPYAVTNPERETVTYLEFICVEGKLLPR